MSNYRNVALNDLAAAFKALSNPHRLRIFLSLSACCPPSTKTTCEADESRCVGELGAALDIAPSTVSHHIKELEQCGLIHIERKGRNILCRVDGNAITTLQNFFKRPIIDDLIKVPHNGIR
jgi:ArsR family transcriptional regulator